MPAPLSLYIPWIEVPVRKAVAITENITLSSLFNQVIFTKLGLVIVLLTIIMKASIICFKLLIMHTNLWANASDAGKSGSSRNNGIIKAGTMRTITGRPKTRKIYYSEPGYFYCSTVTKRGVHKLQTKSPASPTKYSNNILLLILVPAHYIPTWWNVVSLRFNWFDKKQIIHPTGFRNHGVKIICEKRWNYGCKFWLWTQRGAFLNWYRRTCTGSRRTKPVQGMFGYVMALRPYHSPL